VAESVKDSSRENAGRTEAVVPDHVVPTAPPELGLRDVFRSWWPLAASWLLMATEPTLIGAFVSRLPDADIHLAAWGGIVFPVALLVEAPIIMMLAASTALSRDWQSYVWLRRATSWSGFALTVVHALLAFTALYDHVVVAAIGPPEEIIEAGRLGLRLMLPWTWAIADRRFHQGLLIAFGRSRSVGLGTAVRLVVTVSALVACYVSGALPGIAVAGLAVSIGVIGEMVAARVSARSVTRGPLRDATAPVDPLRLGRFVGFYLPLALTPLLTLATQPIGSASLSRMPDDLRALAIWPILNGLVFLSGAAGVAHNEVVVHLAGRRGARPVLRRFLMLLAFGSSALLLLVATTPLLDAYFGGFSDLRDDQVEIVRRVLWIAVPMPALTALRSHLQGLLVHARRTRGVTEAVVVFLCVALAVLMGGVYGQWDPSLAVILAALVLGSAAQCAWLGWRVRALS
jgi:progressive ankylosis protein